MINFESIVKESMKEFNLNWPQILDHPYTYRILIIGGSGSGKQIH